MSRYRNRLVGAAVAGCVAVLSASGAALAQDTTTPTPDPASAPNPVPELPATGATCPASFHVLHDDRIGTLSLPAGYYKVTINSGSLTCARSSALFAQFLQDFDGKLPKPWRYSVAGPGQGTFTGKGSFTVTWVSAAPPAPPSGGGGNTPSGGGGSHGDLQCPGTFEVEHNDRVGALRIPAGPYTITLLGGNLTCRTAERFFAAFLERPSGKLPRGWVVLPGDGQFAKFSSHHGFRIKRVQAS